jgi:hypothetical protein
VQKIFKDLQRAISQIDDDPLLFPLYHSLGVLMLDKHEYELSLQYLHQSNVYLDWKCSLKKGDHDEALE